ncbi:maltose permease [Xylariales sp. PMI_506]|nr:maltose permease [Xylariales sp. PMI_506]
MVEHQEDMADPKSVTVMQEKDEEQVIAAEDILKGAEKATQGEHGMTLAEGLRKYPAACAWSLLFSSALIMEGFDHAFISGFMAFPAFQKRYGVLTADGYQIPAELQSGISNGVNAGEIIGLLINGIAADYFGYRVVMLVSLFLLCAFICPGVLRPYLTMLVSMCWSIGYLLGTSALRGFLAIEGEWAYRIPFALQWAIPIPLAIGILLAPESPWWLIRKGRADDAVKTLRRLGSKEVTDEDLADTVSMMIYTAKVESEMEASTTYLDLFKGVDLRRTEIAVLTYLIQELCAPLVAYIVYFLEQAGLPTAASYDFAMGEYSLAIVGVFIVFYLSSRVGRRKLILSGTLFMTVTTFIIGFLGIPDTKTHPGIANGLGSILLIEYFVFFITIGPVIYTVVTEIPSNNLRTKTVVMARAVYNVAVLVYGQLIPHMVQTISWNWGAKSGFFCGFWMAVILVWAYFRLPETKDRTFAETDILFKNHVKARDFVTTRVDLANQTVEVGVL